MEEHRDIKESIISFIKDFKNKEFNYLNEASTKQSIVSKLLYILKWDIFDKKMIK